MSKCRASCDFDLDDRPVLHRWALESAVARLAFSHEFISPVHLQHEFSAHATIQLPAPQRPAPVDLYVVNLVHPSSPTALRCRFLCISILGRFRTRLGVDPQFVVELKALREKICHCCLTFWNVSVDLEFSIGAHIVDGVELESISNLARVLRHQKLYPTFIL